MDEALLFELPEERPGPTAKPPRIGAKRIRHAVRNQVEFQECSLDELLPDDDQARIVWSYVCGLDLSELVEPIQAVQTGPGQAPADPRILMALWLYATLRGVGTARELDRLCKHHAAYRWLCGKVSMNYHTLADFRVAHGQLLDRLMTQSVATLLVEGLVTLDRVAQDGMPQDLLADGGFVNKDDIDQLGPPPGGTIVHAPVMKAHDPQLDPHTPRADDTPAVAEWRQRMATPEAKAIYRERASTIECVNALARTRGLQRFHVRGLRNAKAVVLWHVLAHDLMRTVALRALVVAVRAAVAPETVY
jgi:transposase